MKWLYNNIFEIVMTTFAVLAVFILIVILNNDYLRAIEVDDFAERNGCFVIGKLTNDNHKYIMTCKDQLIIRRFP